MSGCWCDPSWKKPSNFSKYTTSQLGTPPRGSDKCLLCWSWRHSDNYHSWYCISGNDSVVCKYEPNSDSLVHKQGFGITVGTQRKPYGSECGSWSKLGHISLQLQSHARAAALASFSHSSQGCCRSWAVTTWQTPGDCICWQGGAPAPPLNAGMLRPPST